MLHVQVEKYNDKNIDLFQRADKATNFYFDVCIKKNSLSGKRTILRNWFK